MSSDPEYMRQYVLDRYYRRRAAAIGQLGGRCIVCGSVDDLDFDHVDHTAKAFNIGKAFASMSEVRLQVELAKCQLLCRPHHREKNKIDNGVPHGGGKGGKYIMKPNGKRGRCSCELCDAAYRLAYR